MEILTEFILEKNKERRIIKTEEKAQEILQLIQQDIQSALTVIGRRNTAKNESRLDLNYCIFNAVDLHGANLVAANLRNTQLVGAVFQDADLHNADLCETSLLGATLQGANLSSAKLCNADLSCANLENANLKNANLWGIRWDNIKTTWPKPEEVAKAKNIPKALKEQLGIK